MLDTLSPDDPSPWPSSEKDVNNAEIALGLRNRVPPPPPTAAQTPSIVPPICSSHQVQPDAAVLEAGAR